VEGEVEPAKQEPIASFAFTSGSGGDQSWKTGARVSLIRPPKSTEPPEFEEDPALQFLLNTVLAIARTAGKTKKIEMAVWNLFRTVLPNALEAVIQSGK
jgi:hypothetical protein